MTVGLNGQDGGRAWMVDCHSHVLASGDDGAATLDEGRALTVEAGRRGTSILYATPHVWPHLPLTPDREHAIREAFAQLRVGAGLQLRLGYELTPSPMLLREDPHRYELEGTRRVLMEVPFQGGIEGLIALAEHVESFGLSPVIAHPERTDVVLGDPAVAAGLAARGWVLQVNSTSMLGRHGPAIRALAWKLLDDGTARVVASDGHRWTRPPHLDEAYRAAAEAYGDDAVRLFDGSELGFGAAAETRTRVAGPA